MNAPDGRGHPDASSGNLVLITFDQWRGDWCDSHAPVVELPNIARVAAEGWTARCYANSPQCVPARLGWITGLHASRLGVTTHRNVDLPASAPSIVRGLRDRGWWTELVGKSHLTAHVAGRDLRDQADRMHGLGFDRVLEIAGPRGLRFVSCEITDDWRAAGVLEAHRADLERRYAGGRLPEAWAVRPTVLPPELYPDIWLRRRAEQRLAAMPADRPWMLWVSFVGPHEPFDTPEPWAGRHREASLPPPVPEPGWFADLPRDCSARRSRESWAALDAAAVDACRRDYADHLQLLDEQVGHLMGVLSARSDADHTAVVIAGDHGELLGDGGMLYKGTFLEGAVRVPWIFRPAPRTPLREAVRTSEPLGITALLSDCFERLGTGRLDDRWPGAACEEPGVIAEFGGEVMVVAGDRKLVMDRRRRPLWAIDLERDPQEQINVIRSDPRAWCRDPAWKAMRRLAVRHQRLRRRRGWQVVRLEEVP
ncbi:MAG: sulfatase family protein [Planctomycetota bacterium]|jgi:choline-sulfatase